MMGLYLLILLLLVVALISSEQSVPNECKSENYHELTEQYRVADYKSETKVYETDDNLKSGWYRFNVVAMRMLERLEMNERYGSFEPLKFQPCGAETKQAQRRTGDYQLATITSSFYVLQDGHPLHKYGLKLSSVVSCRYLAIQSSTRKELLTCDAQSPHNCTWKLTCDTNNDRIDIAVRNCGAFFVYYLHPANRQIQQLLSNFPFAQFTVYKGSMYCGTSNPQPPSRITNWQCKQHRSYYDHTRQWNHLEQIIGNPHLPCNDDSSPKMGFLHNVWTRFYNSTSDNITMRLPENCPSFADDYSQLKGKFYCTAKYRGWLLGRHPAIDEGEVERKLCFSEANTCECQISTFIFVINCGGFYVYRRTTKGFPDCFGRACTVPDERAREIRTKSITHSSIKPSEKKTSIPSKKDKTMTLSPTSVQYIHPTSAQIQSNESSIEKNNLPSNQSQSQSMHIEYSTSQLVELTTLRSSQMVMNSVSLSIAPTGMGLVVSSTTPMKSASYYDNANSSVSSMAINPKISGNEYNLKVNSSQSPTFESEMMLPEKTISNILVTPTTTITTRAVMDHIKSTSTLINNPTMSSVVTPERKQIPELTEKSTLDLCNSTYRTVIDDTRLAMFSTLLQTGCDKQYYPAVRFMTSKGEDLRLLEGCQNEDQFKRACSATSNVWLQGVHPEAGHAEVLSLCMKIKYTISNPIDPRYCQCQQKQFVIVQKCSGFFVYRLYPLFPKNRDCVYKYCMEKVPGTEPTPTSKTTTVQASKEIFSIGGSIQIMKPFINDAPLQQKDIDDTETFSLLTNIAEDMLRRALKELKGISRIEVTSLRLGSLIVEYRLSATEVISTANINDTVIQHFTNHPNVDLSRTELRFSGTVNATSQRFTTVDQCESSPCHPNATCISPANNTFSCQCKEGYTGNGFTCDLLLSVIEEEEEVVHEWSTTAIIIVSVVFGVCLVIIVILSFCLCYRASHSYSPRNGFLRGGNLDNYYSTEAPSKDKTLTVPVAHNMYMTSEPTDGTTTFSEKLPMDSLDKQNSNFLK